MGVDVDEDVAVSWEMIRRRSVEGGGGWICGLETLSEWCGDQV